LGKVRIDAGSSISSTCSFLIVSIVERSLVRQACLSLGDRASIKKLLDLVSFEFDEKLEKILKEESIVKSLLITLGRKESHKPKLLRTLRLLATKNGSSARSRSPVSTKF
jgi:hypothetical protein